MPSRSSDTEIDLVPPDEPVVAAYDRDFYTWVFEQAQLVRDGRWDRVDRENVAEEIESLGREQFNKLESAICRLLLQMLKWDYQPTWRSRSWGLSIKVQRFDLEDALDGNLGLRPRLLEATAHAYERARLLGAQETGLDENAFPEQCPYSWDDITSREFVP